jgi:hypothetical protein
VSASKALQGVLLYDANGNALVGQKTMAASVPVVLASDQGPVQTIQVGAPAGATSIIAFGDTTQATVGTFAVRRTTYVEQSANFTGSVVSSNAADAAAGTGARSLKITYLDATGAGPFTETVTLNGTTPVNLANANHCFIEKMEVMSVGAGAKNAGTLSLFTGAGGAGTLVGTVGVGDNQTFWCHHYVPLGQTTNITGTLVANSSTVAGGGCTFLLKAKTIGVATAVEKQVGDTLTLYGQSSQTPRNYLTAIPVAAGPARILMYVVTQSSSSLVYRASFDFYDQ